MKKICLFIALCFISLTMFGCKNKATAPEIIGDQYIFDIDSDDYLVYFYKDESEICNSVYPFVVNYFNETYKNKKLLKIYRVNLKPFEQEESGIYRSFDYPTGQGKDSEGEYFYVDGVREYRLLYIPTCPTLIEIKKNQRGVKEAKLLCTTASEIENYLNDLMD